MATQKQIDARARNFDVLRLKGARATVVNITQKYGITGFIETMEQLQLLINVVKHGSSKETSTTPAQVNCSVCGHVLTDDAIKLGYCINSCHTMGGQVQDELAE